ncbi:PREDICTED: arylsulfatase H-like [Priapulus caudatus]|uniref:Arylsulfatase H-like n=1 Tax=Priapulus caudatus TaxID=37621 RepID=A0ABM1EP98_PRICU|nr:PREDICTED: arylsulfatase H-like [Priapulus caudatus]
MWPELILISVLLLSLVCGEVNVAHPNPSEHIISASTYSTTTTTSHTKRPNIIIMMADDLGYGDVGMTGNDTIRTPNIDSIATKGVKFTHHLAASSVCSPSRAAFLTGRYPIRSGVAPSGLLRVMTFVASAGGLPQNETTMPEILKEAGYSTALIGKWHLGINCEWQGDFCHHPLNHGFDYFYGLPLTNLKDFSGDGNTVMLMAKPNMNVGLGCTVLVGTLVTLLLRRKKLVHKAGFYALLFLTTVPIGVFYLVMCDMTFINSVIMRDFDYIEQPIRFDNLSQRLVSEALEYLTARSHSGQPFMLFMSFVQVHTYLHTADRFKGRSRHGRYGDNVEELDWCVGELLKAVRRLGMQNDTLIYFTSDQGGHVEERGLDGQREGGWNGIFKGGKCMGGMEGALRVPTAMMWPGVVPAGRVVHQPTSLMDVLPTLCHVLDVPLPANRVIDGRNVWPLITGRADETPHDVMFHYCGRDIHAARYSPKDENAVWKVHFATPKWRAGTQGCDFVCPCYGSTWIQWHDPPLMFDLVSDPAETTVVNVSSDAKYEAILRHIDEAKLAHKQSLVEVESQYSFYNTMWWPWLQPCCNYPWCDCHDEKYDNFSYPYTDNDAWS